MALGQWTFPVVFFLPPFPLPLRALGQWTFPVAFPFSFFLLPHKGVYAKNKQLDPRPFDLFFFGGVGFLFSFSLCGLCHRPHTLSSLLLLCILSHSVLHNSLCTLNSLPLASLFLLVWSLHSPSTSRPFCPSAHPLVLKPATSRFLRPTFSLGQSLCSFRFSFPNFCHFRLQN